MTSLNCKLDLKYERLKKPLATLKNTSPPPNNFVKPKTVSSIPHKNKPPPYLEEQKPKPPEDKSPVQEENRYQMRPPVMSPVNQIVSP